ncbi:MAG: hypothetical protein ACTSYL_12825 [Candidatus Thorarchaeota archaeon]
MKLHFSCPKCKGAAEIEMTDEEAAEVRDRIIEQGRSPTLIVKCENGHDLLVTLYNSADGLGIRDVVIPLHSGKDKSKPKSDFDWVSKAFGGE